MPYGASGNKNTGYYCDIHNIPLNTFTVCGVEIWACPTCTSPRYGDMKRNIIQYRARRSAKRNKKFVPVVIRTLRRRKRKNARVD